MLLVFVGLRQPASAGSAAEDASTKELELHIVRGPLESAPAASAASAPTAPVVLPVGWARWCEVAVEEGVTLDEPLQQRLTMMEGVAAKAGRELAEASVRSFLRRHAPAAPAAPAAPVDGN